jgi:hypothetical protein
MEALAYYHWHTSIGMLALAHLHWHTSVGHTHVGILALAQKNSHSNIGIQALAHAYWPTCLEIQFFCSTRVSKLVYFQTCAPTLGLQNCFLDRDCCVVMVSTAIRRGAMFLDSPCTVADRNPWKEENPLNT